MIGELSKDEIQQLNNVDFFRYYYVRGVRNPLVCEVVQLADRADSLARENAALRHLLQLGNEIAAELPGCTERGAA